MTQRTHKVLDLSLREALSLGHNYIGPEHILLAMVRENESVAAAALKSLGLSANDIRNEIVRQLTPPPAPKPKDPKDELIQKLRDALEALEKA